MTFKQLHRDIEKYYRNNNACLDIALLVAELLIEQGKKPEIWKFEAYDSQDFYPQGIKVKSPWRRHFVCVSEFKAYDPIFNKPVPLDQYLFLAFYGNMIGHIDTNYQELIEQ